MKQLQEAITELRRSARRVNDWPTGDVQSLTRDVEALRLAIERARASWRALRDEVEACDSQPVRELLQLSGAYREASAQRGPEQGYVTFERVRPRAGQPNGGDKIHSNDD